MPGGPPELEGQRDEPFAPVPRWPPELEGQRDEYSIVTERVVTPTWGHARTRPQNFFPVRCADW
jgi:hypothetical protein